MAEIDVDQLVFLSPPPEFLHIICSVCLQVLENPRLLSCCGNHLCLSCVESLSYKPCPLCSESFVSLPDKNLQRAIDQCSVRCLNNSKGCEWTGGISNLKLHLSAEGDCQFVTLPCNHQCGLHIPRPELQIHEESECLKRPSCCQHCQNFKSSWEETQKHEGECPEAPVSCPNGCESEMKRSALPLHIDGCPLQQVSCEFAHAGCTWTGARKTTDDHLQSQWKEHISMITISQSQLLQKHDEQIKSLTHMVEKQDKTIDMLASKLQHCIDTSHAIAATPVKHPAVKPPAPPESVKRKTFQFVISEYNRRCLKQEIKHSSPFFVSSGYKLQLSIYCGGRGDGKGNHVSIYAHILPSANDGLLKWPFRGTVTVRIRGQGGNCGHYERQIVYDDSVDLECSGRVDIGVSDGYGYPKFVSHTEARNFYVKNDQLLIELPQVFVD